MKIFLKERTKLHYCIRCKKEIQLEEYLENDHVCDECNQLPNWRTDKRCARCRHYPHKENCMEPIIRDNPESYCGCDNNVE